MKDRANKQSKLHEEITGLQNS